jgi:hypothetical protein
MADSDNSTTLSMVTRRRVLAGTAIAIAGWQAGASARSSLALPLDPAVEVWRRWQATHEQTERLCRQQQRLEHQLIETVGFPRVTIRRNSGESVTLHSLKSLHDRLDLASEDEAALMAAEADFVAHQLRWNIADKEIGYSATLRAEREAANKAAGLLDKLSETPATSLAGVAAKLDAVLREGQAWDYDDEFPWPQIRSAFKDVNRLLERKLRGGNQGETVTSRSSRYSKR